MGTLTMRRGRLLLSAGLAATVLALGSLTGCDPQKADKLVEDVSTEADVKRLFGQPRTVTIAADGTRTLDYPRQPEGVANFVMVIGTDGKLKSLRQLLNPDNFAKIQPGMDRDAVAKILGPHSRERRFELKKTTLVEWRFQDGQVIKYFGANFDDSGKVTSTETAIDENATQPGGN